MVTPATPRRTTTSAALPDDPTKAKVTEVTTKTSEYVAPNPETKNQADRNANSVQGDNQISQDRANILTPQREAYTQDRLSAMFEDVKSSADFDGEQFVAIIVREPDHMTDRFSVPCSTQSYYPPFSFNPSDQMNFIPQIQRFNNNSGGRFSIRITDSQGEDLEIGMKGFVIANPVRENVIDSGANSGGEFAQVLQMMQEDRTRQDNRLEQLIAAMNQPKADDEFTTMVKEKMRNDFLNPPEKKSSFDPAEFAGKLMEGQVMMNAITQMLTQTMQNASGGNGGGREQDKGIIMSLLGNEKVMDIVGSTVENVTNLVGDIALAKAGAESLGPNPPTANPAQPQQTAQPQPEQPTPEQIEAAQNSMKEVSKKIIDELLSENALDDDNEVMNALAEEYPQFLSLIRMSCKANKFDVVHKQLQEFLPDHFESVPADKKEYLETRLHEFYTYMKES